MFPWVRFAGRTTSDDAAADIPKNQISAHAAAELAGEFIVVYDRHKSWVYVYSLQRMLSEPRVSLS